MDADRRTSPGTATGTSATWPNGRPRGNAGRRRISSGRPRSTGYAGWRPVGALSTGQRQRLALARPLCQPADLLQLDEPTNQLSPGLVEELEAALADHPGALVVVSHDRRLRQRWRGQHRTMAVGMLDSRAVAVAHPSG